MRVITQGYGSAPTITQGYAALAVTGPRVTPDPDRASWVRATGRPDPDRATWTGRPPDPGRATWEYYRG